MDADGAAPIPSPSLTVTDGVRSDHVADSPTSSNGAQSTTRSKHVPIARQKTGYERPERARTSHACEPCRERKTKCDGERPACRRCVHTGTNCHYGYGKGWKKRKTAEDLTTTSRKLARCEDLLNEIYPLVTPEVRTMIDEVRQQVFDNTELQDPSSTPTMNVDVVHGSTTASPVATSHLTGTQSAPAMLGRQISLPRGLDTPVQLLPGRSTDSAGSAALRLPSITPEGFLVEGAASPRLSQTTFTARSESSPRKPPSNDTVVREPR